MKIFVAEYQPGRVGGGWSFADNFVEGMHELITEDYDEADIFFIASPSMVQRDTVKQAKADGKKIVLRIDNAVRNSRNRNTGMSRMKDFADWADLIIFQSHWAKEYLESFIKKSGKVIMNGVNLDNYFDQHNDPENHILYSRFNRDETKNWEVARYWFSQYQLEHPNAKLHIVGQFSRDLIGANFDFYNDENFEFYGVVDKGSLARLYSISKLLYTYFNDACSNTLIEALISGCQVVGDSYYHNTGGAREIIDTFSEKGRAQFSLYRMCAEYNLAMEKIV